MHFTRNERIFSLMVLGIAFSIYCINILLEPSDIVPHKRDVKDILIDSFNNNAFTDSSNRASYTKMYTHSKKNVHKNDNVPEAPTYFYFDPNSISVNEWNMLGVKTYIAQSIGKYIEKGGRFYKPEDLYKVYLLPKAMAEKLIPYVAIKHANVEETKLAKSTYIPYVQTKRKENISMHIDINTADTSALKQLNGIGSAYASRIVNYRNKLGGFASIEQLAETYGINNELFNSIRPYLTISQVGIKKLNINLLTVEELAKHPYVSIKSARAMVNYRMQHGNKFTSLDQLNNILLLDEATILKIRPYITIE